MVLFGWSFVAFSAPGIYSLRFGRVFVKWRDLRVGTPLFSERYRIGGVAVGPHPDRASRYDAGHP